MTCHSLVKPAARSEASEGSAQAGHRLALRSYVATSKATRNGYGCNAGWLCEGGGAQACTIHALGRMNRTLSLLFEKPT